MYNSRKLDVKHAPADAVVKSDGVQEAIMKKRSFGKTLGFFAVVFGLTLAGCTMESEKASSGGSSTTKLVEGEWTEGKISKEGRLKKYSISVTKGVRYFIWLNDSEEGDRTKTADVGLKISHEDGTVICDSYGNASKLYTEPLTFSASSTGTVTITAAAGGWYHWEEGTGTYAIKYTSRPEYDILTEENWKDDSIIAIGQTNKYTFYAAEKTRYFIYLDDTDAGSGITTKTADAGLKISHSDGTVICSSYNNASNLYIEPYTFIASSSGTITITAAAGGWYHWEERTGTYAIKYTSRPEYITLTEGVWKDDEIITPGQTNKYYIPVVEGMSYSIYLDDTDAGSGITTKTADAGLKIFYSGGTVICNSYNDASDLYKKPYTFVAPSSGTITITVAAGGWYHWEERTGTYAIKYTIGDSN